MVDPHIIIFIDVLFWRFIVPNGFVAFPGRFNEFFPITNSYHQFFPIQLLLQRGSHVQVMCRGLIYWSRRRTRAAEHG